METLANWQGIKEMHMIGMVLVTHGALADEFRAALEHVVGVQENMASICIGADDNMEKRRQDIVDAIGTVDNGAGVVLLTDMFGGTPSNLAISLLEKNRVEVIAGINLPMLIKLASIRDSMDLAEAVLEAKQAAQKYISVASEVLGEASGD
jgi:PTS system mannose-specific IIA component